MLFVLKERKDSPNHRVQITGRGGHRSRHRLMLDAGRGSGFAWVDGGRGLRGVDCCQGGTKRTTPTHPRRTAGLVINGGLMLLLVNLGLHQSVGVALDHSASMLESDALFLWSLWVYTFLHFPDKSPVKEQKEIFTNTNYSPFLKVRVA